MKKTKFLIGVCLSLSVTVAASAQTSPRVVTCDTTVAPQALLQVQDEASSKGAVVQNATLVTLASGQVNAFVLLCLVIFLFALDSNRDKVAGCALAIGILLKVFPIVFCAWLLWKQFFGNRLRGQGSRFWYYF